MKSGPWRFCDAFHLKEFDPFGVISKKPTRKEMYDENDHTNWKIHIGT